MKLLDRSEFCSICKANFWAEREGKLKITLF